MPWVRCRQTSPGSPAAIASRPSQLLDFSRITHFQNKFRRAVIIGLRGPSLLVKESNRRRTLQSVIIEEPGIAIPSEIEGAFRAYHGLVFRTAYRITGNAADAEDVLQVVFLRLLRRGLHAEAPDNPESYLRRAAINAALDVIRSRQSDRTVALPADLAHGDSPELRQALGRAVAQLNPRSAEIFALRFLEGFTNPQIAKMLGISQVLVAVIVYRTRQQLRKELSSYLGGRP
jgi:RNA polymerase sigma-70 factor, ECF subfamily